MSVNCASLFHSAGKCPVAYFLKFLLAVSLIYALHVAAFHQTDVSPYIYFLLIDAVGVIAIMALAFNWNCQFRKVDKKEKLTN
jgi:hypothetical protein